MLSSAGVAPLPPSFRRLLSVRVTTCAVFPSLMYLLGGDDSCMLSVPSCACDLHNCCWQGGDICQATAAAAFTLFNYDCGLLPKEDDLLSALPCDLPTCHLFRDSRLLGLTLRPFAPVFHCHQVSWTRGRLAFAQEAVRVSPFSIFSIFLLLLIFARSFRQASSKFLWWHLPGGLRRPVSNFSSSDVEM